jgi:cysteinyl-tRNA synthetase, unknown class
MFKRLAIIITGLIGLNLVACEKNGPNQPPVPSPVLYKPSTSLTRGFPTHMPWASCYGKAKNIDIPKVAQSFRIINIDADPDTGNFTVGQIAQLKSNGQNKVISYLNLGSIETWRSYWKSVPSGYKSLQQLSNAHLGRYSGYPDEIWLDLSNSDYQQLVLDYIAPRLLAMGVDGFFFDNLEIMSHSPDDSNGPGSPAILSGGMKLIKRLRDKFPNVLFVMQNATEEVIRNGIVDGVPYPSLLDGISHEDVYAPNYNPEYVEELKRWQNMRMTPGGKPFWVATEDYVGNSINKAQEVFRVSQGNGFSSYVADESAGQQKIFFWNIP